MKNQFNSGLYLGILFISISLISTLTSCNKNEIIQQEAIPQKNTTYTIQSSEIFDIRASDVYTEADSLKRKIEIIDKRSNTISETFYISIISEEFSSNLYTQLRDKSLTGLFKIESNNKVLYKLITKNGEIVPQPKNDISKNIKSNMIPTCTLSLVHGCVAQKIEQMNIFEYGICLAGAPACYAGLWAECAGLYCIVGQQDFTNL